MKKIIVVLSIVLVVVVAIGYSNRIDRVQEYYQLPGNTTWKLVDNVMCPGDRPGFKLINAEGEENYYVGSTSEWNIDLETGKCYNY